MVISRILHLIEITGLSQKELISSTGLSGSAITEWKKGKAKPSTDAIIKISSYFSVPIEYILGLGIFEKWSEIIQHKDAVWNAIGDSPYSESYLATADGKSLRALFYEAMYTEPNDLSMIRLFSWSIKSIHFSPRTDNEGQESIDAFIEFSDIILLLLPGNSAQRSPNRVTMADAFNNFMEGHFNTPRYALSDDERRLLDMYGRLTDIEKGEVLGTVNSILNRKR